MSPSDSQHPLCYNKENVSHTIKELKANNNIFKILSDLMKSINPISAEAEIVNAMLIPLVERMTYSQDDSARNKSESSSSDESSSASILNRGIVDNSELEQDTVNQDIEVQYIDNQSDPEDEEDEDEEEEDEGEDDEELNNEIIGDNATNSDNLSLDDMIEELEYEDEIGPDSGSDDPDQIEIIEESEGDQEMQDNDENDIIDQEEFIDEIQNEFQADEINPGLMVMVDDSEAEGEGENDQNDENDNDNDDQEQEQEDQEENDSLNFNAIEMEENQINRAQFIPRPNVVDYDLYSDDLDLDNNDMEDVEFHQIFNFIHRRNGNHNWGNARHPFRAPIRAYDMNYGFGQRRPIETNARNGLDSLYNIDRTTNDNEFWENNFVSNTFQNNRNRSHRPINNFFDSNDAINNLISRDINQIRDRLENQALGTILRRDRERVESLPTSNPFEIIRRLTCSYNEINEAQIEASCEVSVIEKKPTKEEIEKDQNKEIVNTFKQTTQPGISEAESRRRDFDPLGIFRNFNSTFGSLRIPGANLMQSILRNTNEINEDESNEEIKSDQDQININNQQNSSQMLVDEISNEENKDQDVNNPSNVELSHDVDSEQPTEQFLSDAQSRINNLLSTFNLNRTQVENSGIDLSVIEVLPESELIELLSGIANNNQIRNDESENLQLPIPQEDPSQSIENSELPSIQNVELQSSPRISSRSQSNSANPPIVPNLVQSNQSSVVIQSEQDSLTNMMQSLLNMPAHNIAEPFMQVLNSANTQPRSSVNDLQQMLGSLEASLQGMNSSQNPPRRENTFRRPNPFIRSNPAPNPFNRSNPPPNPFAGNANNNINPPPAPNLEPLPASIEPQPAIVQPPQPASAQVLPEGIDADFFNSLPEEYKQELLNNENLLRRNMGQELLPSPAPAPQPEQVDTTSFLESITDESLRREILIGMDEPTLNTLSAAVQEEARRYRREIMRRQYRREFSDRLVRGMINRDNFRARDWGRNDRANQVMNKADNFLDIIKRRDEKNGKNGDDVGKITLSTVFNDDKNLKNLMKIIIVESQRKDPIKFERLIKPYENLCKHNLIRGKLHQVLMLMLNHYKTFT